MPLPRLHKRMIPGSGPGLSSYLFMMPISEIATACKGNPRILPICSSSLSNENIDVPILLLVEMSNFRERKA